MPNAADLAEALTHANFAEPAFDVQRSARMVGGDDLGLQSPNALGLGNSDQALHQERSDAVPTKTFAHIDADLSDAGCASRVCHARQGREADNRLYPSRDQSPGRQMALVPRRPERRRCHEGCKPRGEALGVDRANAGPVGCCHSVNVNALGHSCAAPSDLQRLYPVQNVARRREG